MGKKAGAEKQIQNDIIDWLQSKPFVHRAWQNDRIGRPGRKILNRFRPDGFPDVGISFRGGRCGFIECKRGEKEIDSAPEAQKNFIASEALNGSFAMFACSLDQVKDQLRKEGYSC